jgi:hypothetical protein
MRTILFIFLTFFIIAATAQTQLQVAKFDNAFKLKDGIYTSSNELFTNDPALPNCLLITNPNKNVIHIDELNYCLIGQEDNPIKFNGNLIATVLNGKLSVYYQKQLITIYSKGTLCFFTFTKVKTTQNPVNHTPLTTGTRVSLSTSNTRIKSYACFFDIQNGTIQKLDKENLGLSIMRDSVLYKAFLKTKPGRKNKNLFKYISDFNSRNPSFLPIREKNLLVEEEERE